MAMNLTGVGTGRLTRGRSGRRAPMAEINVTPLVDVMLVLLIIFMVTAPLLTSAVPVELPEAAAQPLDQPPKPIEVAIDPEGAVYVDGQRVPDSALEARLSALAEGRSATERQVLLRGDKRVAYGRMMTVMAALSRAGLTSISLVTAGSDGGP